MKTLLLVAGGRSGSDFFQSLLDGHPQVLQFPGTIKTNKAFIQIISQKNPNNISSEFIKNYIHFFDSRIGWGKVERHDRLGEDKSHYFTVDQNKFKTYFFEMFEKRSKNLIKNRFFETMLILHQAYAKACDQDITKKKIMIINSHLVEWTKYFGEKINNVDFDIIHMIRNPLSNITSLVNNWLNYDNGKYFLAQSMYFHLDLIVNGIKKLKKINKKVLIIQLEMLHYNHSNVMNDFCKNYDLDYQDSMKNATVFKLKWWSDKISGKDLSGIDKNFKVSYNEKLFYKRDIEFLEYILKNHIIFYQYKFIHENKKFILNLFPLKCELLTWKNTIKQKRIKHILSIPFFYIKKIIFINKYFSKKNNMPYSFGTNYKN